MVHSSDVYLSNITKKNHTTLIFISVCIIIIFALVAAILGIVVKIEHQSRVSQTKPSVTTSTSTTPVLNENTTIIPAIKDFTKYHFIIVGCGTSGAVLASRLSENPNFRVICIEKGPSDLPSDNDWNGMGIPRDFNFLSPHDPIAISSRQQSLNRLIYVPRSMGLGGTSRIYGMINVRPSPDSLLEWPQGWHYDDLLPYYKKLEDHYCHHEQTNISKEECELYHGKSGPMQVNSLDPTAFHNASKAFREICYDTSQPWKGYSGDYNGDITNKPHGCSLFQQFKYRPSNTSGWARGSSKTGYITTDILKRPNLSIIVDSTVTRIVFDDTARAIGVEYFDPISRTVKRISALHEVIIAAGAFATPHLLQVSGVGDPNHLKKIGVTLVANNSYVGKNLADHLSLPYIVQLNGCDEAFSDMNGPFSWLMQFNSGVRKHQSNNIRDIQIYFMDAADGIFTYQSRFCSAESKEKCNADSSTNATFRIILQNIDFSSGTVQALTSSIFDKPTIDLGWTKLSDDDKEAYYMAINLLRSYTTNKSSEFGKLIAREILPGTLSLDDYMKKHIESALHPACTCRMGFCTDDQLVVRGTRSLRVCDASSFGSQIDANPAATIYAMAEMLSDKLIQQYTVQRSSGIWKIRDTMLVFESSDITSSTKIASFDLEATLISTNPRNSSDWHLLNTFVGPRLEDLHSSGYKIVIFTSQLDLCNNNNNTPDTSIFESKRQWQLKIEMITIALKVPVQIFTSTCNDDYHKPRTAMWRDFTWLFNDGVSIDHKASFYVAWRDQADLFDNNVQFAANIPLQYYTTEQQFTNNTSSINKQHFNVIQTVRISATADAVWKLIGGFFDIHKWHPQISATEFDDQQTAIKRRVIFAGEMIDTIEQLQILDDHKREYQYKNVGGNWGRTVQNYDSKLQVMEDDNGRSSIVRWSGSFDSHADLVSDFYRIGLNSLAQLFSPPLPCSGGNSYFNKTLPTIKGRPNLAVYWRQEFNINASELWKYVGVWKGTLNGQLSYEPGSEYSFKLPDPTPRIYETLLSYDRTSYEFVYCMRATVPRSLPVTNYVSMKKVVSTGPMSSAWIRTGHMIVDDGTTADQAANQVLTNVFVSGGERLRQQLQNATRNFQ
ncbi:unnamed protein product [Adineta steineri]|uniref:Glucose-methanol-choline oxidoreductase N-terminal domain-containing protein n=1 Tax=Adineta steineri TaxID=433720 RepID=A0A813YJ35_9BILA|nr:unnamed protein product [Adineta steineri]CAF3552640.1 unnamed protein product [Adineta steineri]